MKNTFCLFIALALSACGGGEEETSEAPNPTPEVINNAPVISGIPATAKPGADYIFTPTLSDSDGDKVSLTAKDLPTWLVLSETGVGGTPMDEDIGEYTFIIIASDGKDNTVYQVIISVVSDVTKEPDTVTPPPTEITPPIEVPDTGTTPPTEVTPPIEKPEPEENAVPVISGTPEQATQGLAYSFTPIATDTDNDKLSFSATNLPGWLTLDGTTGQISGTPLVSHIGTHSNIALIVSDGIQSSAVTFTITVIKAHIVPELITISAEARVEVPFSFSLLYQGEDDVTINYSALNLPAWLTLDNATGVLTGTPKLEHVGAVVFAITLDDGFASQTVDFSIQVAQSWLELAIATGDALLVKDNEIILDAALFEIENIKAHFIDIKRQLFKLDSPTEKLTAIDWDPTRHAIILRSQDLFNGVVLNTTNSNQTNGPNRVLPIAIAGSKTQKTGRYLAFGGNPFRNSKNAEMEQFLHNGFDWLTQQKTAELTQFNVVFTQLDDNDRSQTRAWFDANVSNISYNENGACDGDKLSACMAKKPDVIIVSHFVRDGDDKDALINSIKSALAQDISVIYVHRGSTIDNHGTELLSLINVSYAYPNNWWKLYLSAFDPASTVYVLPAELVKVKTLFTNFKNKFFDVDLSGCTTRNCPAESNTQVEFFDGANVVSSMFNNFNNQKVNIFASEGARLSKLIILLADHYRQSVSYPMDKITTDTVKFFESMFADYAIYNVRNVNAAQADMGNFSRSDFNHITPENAQVTLISKPSFRSAGVYALPGQTFTVTRTDNNIAETSIFINTLRSEATHIFNKDKYNRPRFLTSGRIAISPGETIKFTSSYGGPVQIGFSQKDVEVSFDFKGIGRHPHWRTPADDFVFAQNMDKGDYDWAEIATEGFEVHSKLERLRTSLSDSIWPVASDFANATYRYTHNMVHKLAGFKGPGIDVDSEIHDFVTDRGLSVDTIDHVKHMNADQPTCGWGCSGNPYDAGWAFSPIGHGDLHELGHGIERDSMRFEGYGGHSNTNVYSFYAKSVYSKDTGNGHGCWGEDWKKTFDALQQSKKEVDPSAYMKENLLNVSSNMLLYYQIMMAAETEGTITDGWNVYPRMHIWDREMWRLDNSDESWNAGRVGLGFGDYTRSEFSAATKNERLFISLSEITQLDLTQWFEMYGFDLSAKAIAQVNSKSLPVLAQKFYTIQLNEYCQSFTQPSLPVDGKQVWPFTP